LGGGGIVLFDSPALTDHGMSAARASLVIPLLEAQPYVTSAVFSDTPPQDTPLNHFREFGAPGRNIADLHLAAYGLSGNERDLPWLSVPDPVRTTPVVISRTPRYRTNFPWHRVTEKYRSAITFLGLACEHQSFCRRFGAVAYYPTRNLLEAARIIAGCYLFIGNQGSLSAIAHGLFQNQVLAIHSPNCYFERANLVNAWGGDWEPPEVGNDLTDWK
jgi:hypothetical protein